MKPGDLLECPDGRRLFVDWYNRQANVFIVYDDQNHELLPGKTAPDIL